MNEQDKLIVETEEGGLRTCNLGPHPGTALKFNSGNPALFIYDNEEYEAWFSTWWGRWLRNIPVRY